MQKIDIKTNKTGLKIFINGKPDIKLMPKIEAENLIDYLELQVAEYFENEKNKKAK